jgi:hypothetical protein
MPSLENVLEFALQFCFYEMMVLNNGDRSYFESLVQTFELSGDKSELFNYSKNLYEVYKKDVRCGVNLEVFRNYLNKINENSVKDDLNLEFRAYCATKAVIGNKQYKKTRYKEIFSLMFGYTCYDEIKPETRLKLTKIEDSRYMKRLLEKLQDNWHLSVYSRNSRGLYISYKLSLHKLILEVKKNKYIYKNKQQIAEKKADKMLDKLINDDDLVIDDDCVIDGDS